MITTINNNNVTTTAIITANNIQERLKLLSISVKIQQLLIIMQYLSDIGDNPVHTYGACMYTSVLMTDSAIAACRNASIIIVVFVTHASLSQKILDTCNNRKDGG